MKIQDEALVAINYKLTIDSGEVVDESEEGEPIVFIHNTGAIIPGLDDQLKGMEAGQTVQLTVESDDAYGASKEELVQEVPRSNFPEDIDIEPGSVFQASGPHGPMAFRVVAVTDDVVKADFNHPLAGQRLHFDVEIVEVREATEDEKKALTHSCDPHECGSCGGEC